MEADHKNSLSKNERLFLNRDIENLFAKGKAFMAFPLRVLYLWLDDEHTAPVSVFVSIPKKRIKMAHDRNRLKRLVRECYRVRKHELIEKGQREGKTLFVGFVYVGNEMSSHTTINQAISKSFDKLSQLTS